MKFISGTLYFLNNHPAWSALIIFCLCMLVWYFHNKVIYFLLGFLLPMANLFLANHINAVFLNAYGARGTAVITQVRQLNATYNDVYVREFDAVVRTPEGKDVTTRFTTQAASIYPLRNMILLPPVGEAFIVKYIPGVEKNIVILSDESAYGLREKIHENREPVEKARLQYEASPGNAAFREEYIRELKTFVGNRENAPDSAGLLQYHAIIAALETR